MVRVADEAPKSFGKTSKKLTRTIAEKILAGVREGLPKATAASLAGVSKQLLRYWDERGQESLAQNQGEATCVYSRFSLQLDQALAEYQADLVRKLNRSATDKTVDHRPLKALLAVRFPTDFAHKPMETAKNSAQNPEFETVSPEEATSSVAAKLAEYLAAADLEATPVAPSEEQTPSATP